MNKFKTITHEQLRAKIDEKATFVLLETTPVAEFELGHLPGAMNLPMTDIESRASDMIPSKRSKVVVYGTGSESDASEMAAKQLVSMGCTRVYHFAGGKAEWNATTTPTLIV